MGVAVLTQHSLSSFFRSQTVVVDIFEVCVNLNDVGFAVG